MDGQYDVALAFGSAFSTCFVADCVAADRKYHSVIADSRILGEDQRIQASYLRELDGALAVSEHTSSIFVEMYPFMKPTTRVLYNYLPKRFDDLLVETDSSHGRHAYEGTVLVTVARLDPLKGFDMAIEACGILKKTGYPVLWLVLGDGPERARLTSVVGEHGLTEDFRFLGFQSDPSKTLREADIFVLPSETEGKSVAIDEAKYLGLPIVATQFETVGEQVVDGVNGLVCEFSALDLADKIAELIDNPTLAERISATNRGRADSDKNGDLTDYLLSL